MQRSTEAPAVDLTLPSVCKQIAKKHKQRQRESKQPRFTATDNGLPDGQARARDWVVLDLGLRPSAAYDITPEGWTLQISGQRGASSTSWLPSSLSSVQI